MKTQPITSAHNPRVQQIRALLNQKGARSESGLFVVEGVRLAEEAAASGLKVQAAFFSRAVNSRGMDLLASLAGKGVEVNELSEPVLESLSATETSQGLLLVLPQKAQEVPPISDFALVLDQVRDPGNLGTILRSAAAAGVQVVYLTPGTADAFAPKVVRAGMGAHFRLSIQTAAWPEILNYCKHICPQPLSLYLAESSGGKVYWQANLSSPVALVIGGEAEGASAEVKKTVDDYIYIPMPGQFESLNAAAAAGILLFEVVRQRSIR